MSPPTPQSGGPSRVAGDRVEGRSPSRLPVQDQRDDAWTLMVELVTATLVWGGIGWLLDRWLGTGPWLMCTGFVVGNGAGIYLIWLRTNEPAPTQANDRTTTEGPRDATG